MDPTVWGPSFWFVLHTVSLNYPERPTYVEKRTHHDFYRIVQHILPCEACRRHYKELFATYPIEPFLTSKQSLVTWVVMIHNQVNKRLGKPLDMKQTLSEDGVEDDSAQLRAVGIDPDDHVRAKLWGRGGWSTSWGAGGGFGALYSVSVFVVWCS